MEKRLFTLLILSLLTVFNGFSQVVIGDGDSDEKTEAETTVEKVKEIRDIDSVTQLYFNTNWSNTYRTLSPNGSLFGEDVGIRADETSANFWSFGFGLRNQLAKHFSLEIGVGLVRNGEKYSFEDPVIDSSSSYETRYTFVSMPIVGYYTYGNEIKLFAGAGIMPQLFMSQVTESEFISSNNTKSKDEVKIKSGTPQHASFASSAIFRVGVQLKYSPLWSLYVMPEYRVQLTSTYGKTTVYSHKATAIGFNIGLTYQL